MSSSALKNVIHPKARSSASLQPTDLGSHSDDPANDQDEMSQVLGVLVENAPVAMAMFDGAMRYVLANRQWIREFGLQNTTPLVGRSQYEIFPNLHPGWRQVYERALQGHIVRSEHDAGGQNMVYRWEVRPWRQQKDASRVGGLMITCEKFCAGTTDPQDAAPTAETKASALQPDPFDCSLPMLVLDEHGVILRANDTVARESLERGIDEGKTTFWEVFATTANAGQLRQQWQTAIDLLEKGDSPATQTLLTSHHGTDAVSRWIVSKMKVGTPRENEDSPLLFAAVGFPTNLLPVEKVPAPALFPQAPAAKSLPLAPPPLPAISDEELEKLELDLSRTRQELRTMQEAERTFVKREARLRSFLESVPCGIFVLDERGRPVYQNERLKRLLGRPLAKEETVEAWLAHACPTPEHREHVSLVWRESVWRRQLTRTVSLATADGLLKELQFQPISLADGGMLVSIQDDTENCRHEEQLRSMEAKLRSIMLSCPIAIVLTDKTGVIFEVNQHAETLLGQAKSDLRRNPIDAWLEPESATARRDALRMLRHQGTPSEALGVRVKRPDGTVSDVIMSLASVPDAQGEPHATIHYFQQPVEDVETRSEPTAEAPPECPVHAPPATTMQTTTVELLSADASGRITTWSEHAHQLFDFDAAMAIGRPLHLLFRPSDATGFFAELTAQAAAPEDMVDHSYFGAQGRGTLPLSVHRRDEGGFVLLTQMQVAVPVEPVEMEHEVHACEPVNLSRPPRAPGAKAFQVVSPSIQRWPVVDLDREKLMLSETHHRIKNHLQIISSLLNLQINGVSDQHARNALRSSQNRVRAIAALHQHLYQLALGNTGTFSDFTHDLVQHLRECYETSADTTSVQVAIQDGNIQPEWLMPLALTINEALSNSFEHAFPHGRPGSITASLTFSRETGELTIQDDGIGLPVDFHPGESSGLGLKILAVFAEQMRGQLFVQGTPDKGTEIKLRFPMATIASV